MQVTVVYNKKSGSIVPEAELQKKFTAASITVTKFIDISNQNFSEQLHDAAQDNAVIAAIGGDGTISSVASELIDTKAILAPLPGGTLNHFTKDMHIPQDLDEAIANIAKQAPTRVDIACVNQTVFINNSSIGLYPGLLKFRDDLQKRSLSKVYAMIIGAIRSFARFKTYTVTINDTTYRTPFLFVGNNDYHLSQNLLGERQQLDAGSLCLYTVRGTTRLDFIVSIIRRDNRLVELSGTSFTLTTRKTWLRVSHDGEHSKLATPLRYEIMPKALRVIGGNRSD